MTEASTLEALPRQALQESAPALAIQQNVAKDAFLCDIVSHQLYGSEILVFELRPRQPLTRCSYEPGAHLELQLAAGPRQYSLCNHHDGSYRLAVQREVLGRGGSQEIFASIPQKEPIWVRGPLNHFDTSALHTAEHVKLIAGGIGITPILAMAYARYQHGQSFELHYSTKRSSDMVFADELKGMAALHPRGTAQLYCSQDHSGKRLDIAEALGDYSPQTQIYVCGPARMIEAVQDAAFALGWPDEQLHFERFTAAAPVAQAHDQTFEVEIASSGLRIPVAPDETVAQALAKQGIVIPISCAAGVCGSCRTRILSGQADHRDLFYSPQEQASQTEFTPCCSRACSPLLVLDL